MKGHLQGRSPRRGRVSSFYIVIFPIQLIIPSSLPPLLAFIKINSHPNHRPAAYPPSPRCSTERPLSSGLAKVGWEASFHTEGERNGSLASRIWQLRPEPT